MDAPPLLLLRPLILPLALQALPGWLSWGPLSAVLLQLPPAWPPARCSRVDILTKKREGLGSQACSET